MISNIVTNGVVVQREQLLLVSFELNHCSAFVLVPLKNTAHLEQQQKTRTNGLKTVKMRAGTPVQICLPVLSAHPGQP